MSGHQLVGTCMSSTCPTALAVWLCGQRACCLAATHLAPSLRDVQVIKCMMYVFSGPRGGPAGLLYRDTLLPLSRLLSSACRAACYLQVPSGRSRDDQICSVRYYNLCQPHRRSSAAQHGTLKKSRGHCMTACPSRVRLESSVRTRRGDWGPLQIGLDRGASTSPVTVDILSLPVHRLQPKHAHAALTSTSTSSGTVLFTA